MLSQDKASFQSLNPHSHTVNIVFRMETWSSTSSKSYSGAFWLQYAEELWRYLDVPLNDDALRQIYSLPRLSDIIWRYLGNSIASIVLSGAVGLLCLNAFLELRAQGSSLSYLAGLTALITIYGIPYTWKNYFKKYLRFRRLQAKLYPDR